jgi:hypothetical protein
LHFAIAISDWKLVWYLVCIWYFWLPVTICILFGIPMDLLHFGLHFYSRYWFHTVSYTGLHLVWILICYYLLHTGFVWLIIREEMQLVSITFIVIVGVRSCLSIFFLWFDCAFALIPHSIIVALKYVILGRYRLRNILVWIFSLMIKSITLIVIFLLGMSALMLITEASYYNFFMLWEIAFTSSNIDGITSFLSIKRNIIILKI